MTPPQAPRQTQDGSKNAKQWNCLELGARFQLSALEGVEGRVETPRLDQEEGQAIHSFEPASNQPTSWLVHILGHLWCQDKPRATLDSLDSPRLGLRGSHHLPPYSILCSSLWGLHPNGIFFPGLSRRSPETVPVWTPGTLGIHNFLLRPRIGMRSKEILQLSLRAFQRHVVLLLQTLGSGRFLTFSGRESNCQFDSRPFFCP